MNDDFEKRLQQMTPREVPADWRKEILAHARLAAVHPPMNDPQSQTWAAALLEWIRKPRGLAWGSVGGVWILILTLNLSSPAESNLATAQPLPSASAIQVLQRQKQFLLAELNGVLPPTTAVRPQAKPLGPRSDRPNDLFPV